MSVFRNIGLSLALVCTVSAVASAGPIGPVYPPPGGVSFSGVGGAGDAGGRTNTYSSLDTSAYDDLYWGPWGSTAGDVGAGLDGALNLLTLQSFLGNVATFAGVTSWVDADPNFGVAGTGTVMTVPVRLNISLTGATWVPSGSVSLPTALGVVAPITGSGFTANLTFEANYGRGWMPLNQVPQIGAGKTKSSFSGGFYYTEVKAVPDSGGTLTLVGLAMLGLAAFKRQVI